jgi:hypothetical protein
MRNFTEHVPLSEVLSRDGLGLLREAMNGVGPAAQTLSAMRRLASIKGETFASIRIIADDACLKQRTVKHHLRKPVHFGWLECQGRRGRRTPTYSVPLGLINRSGRRKFAILPRWAARLLPTWSERAVFACIISRDMLCTDVLGDEVEDGGECYRRRIYTISALEKDTGLCRPAIVKAKRKLVERGLVTIDPAVNDRDELGRLHADGDTLLLNLDFPVPIELLARRDRSRRTPARPRKPNRSSTVNRSKKVAPTQLESGPSPGKNMAREAVKNWPPQLNKPLNESLNGTTNGTAGLAAEEPPAAPVNTKAALPKRKKPHEEIDFEERRRTVSDALRVTLDSEYRAAD